MQNKDKTLTSSEYFANGFLISLKNKGLSFEWTLNEVSTEWS